VAVEEEGSGSSMGVASRIKWSCKGGHRHGTGGL
jgi:hypothetical protein